LRREFHVEANYGRPQVAYKETITAQANGEEKYVRQSGGKGQYGHIWLRLAPNAPGKGLHFESEIVGGKVPREFVAAAERGVAEAMQSGVLAGYPLVDLLVTAFDGSFHDVDSSEVAFKIAGSMALRDGASRAGPVLLEPIMACEVVTPEESMGDVIGDLNARRGKIQGMGPRPGGVQVIDAQVPLSTMFGYVNDLRSRTQGRATFTMQFSHYAQIPKAISDEIVARVRGH